MRIFTLCTVIALLILSSQLSQAIEIGQWEGFSTHQIRGTLSFLTPTTLRIEGFNFDGGGVRVFFYYYRPGQSIDGRSGVILPIQGGGPRGMLNRRYNNEDFRLEFPAGVTACDMGAITIWCEPFFATFSRITVPRTLFLNNGEGECQLVGGNTNLPTVAPVSFDNCVQYSNLQVSWTVNRANNEVDFQLCGCRTLDPSTNQYMGFGLSGRNDSTFMVGADATIAWVDNSDGRPNAVDYFLTGRFQCRAGEGACPDTMVTRNGQTCSNNIRASSIAGGIRNDNQQCVMFSRPFSTGDNDCDISINPDNQQQFIVWAIGGLGETAFIHFERADPSTPPIHLGRTASNQCSQIMCASCPPFIAKRMPLPESTTLRVRIGPSGGERGYMGITGQAGWGISWYINDTLIPILEVQRGKTYTFIVEGGSDETNLAQYHPFYITDSPNGGRLQNMPEARQRERVFAGFVDNDRPIGVGRLCDIEESTEASNIRQGCGDFDAYLTELRSQSPNCLAGSPGQFTWTPDETTPNLVYYQCATHLNLGWQIVVGSAVNTSPVFPSIIALIVFSTLLFM